MPKLKLTKSAIDRHEPADQAYFLWDTEVRRFGLKIEPTGRRGYFIKYRTVTGRRGTLKLGDYAVFQTVDEARRLARKRLAEVDDGSDPARDRTARRRAATMQDLADRYIAEHLPKKKPRSAKSDRSNLRLHVLPLLGARTKVAEVGTAAVSRMHSELADTPGAANRVLALVSKMLNLAVVWEMRPAGSNPCKHVTRYPSKPRSTFLTDEGYRRLAAAVDWWDDETDGLSPAVSIVRLLMRTGARLGEIHHLTRSELNLSRGQLNLAESKTGRKTIQLDEESVRVLRSVPIRMDSRFVFPARDPSKPTGAVRYGWDQIRKRAGYPKLRLHDLRHSYVSFAIRNGADLEAVGAQLGHRSRITTDKYKHLVDEYVRGANQKTNSALSELLSKDRDIGETA